MGVLRYEWDVWARDNQLVPQWDWYIWLLLAGRGYGKTRVGAEMTRMVAQQLRGCHIALVAETAADARDVIVEGPESGILAVSPPWFMPKYEPSKRRLTWPNGSYATTYSGDEPDQLRGPQHHFAWADELAKWKYAQEAWDNLEFGLRLGKQPRAVVTTTPRPIPIIKQMVKDKQVQVTTGSTYENVHNLAATFIQRVVKKYEGTRLGRQELHAVLLDDNPDALWKRQEMIEDHRRTQAGDLQRIVVGVDPSASSGGAETGIIVAGRSDDDHFYVLDDRSVQGSPDTWAREAVTAYHVWKADRIVGETNNGGEMVEHTLRTVDPNIAYTAVHASRGKHTRAEPVAALYEQGRGHHVGMFAELEDQMCQWTPGEESPDRMDALVWAATELMIGDYGSPLDDETRDRLRSFRGI